MNIYILPKILLISTKIYVFLFLFFHFFIFYLLFIYDPMKHAINGNYRYVYSILNNAIKNTKNSNQCEKWFKAKMEIQFKRSLYKREYLNARIIHSILMALDNENSDSEIDSLIRKTLFLNSCQQKSIVNFLFTYIYIKKKNKNNNNNNNNNNNKT